MTLKEKFKQWLDTDPRVQIRDVQLEVIAEDFAIDFGQWLLNQPYRVKYNDKKELLEIYKETL